MTEQAYPRRRSEEGRVTVDIDQWQQELAAEAFEKRMADWVRRWDEADRIYDSLPPETKERICETATRDVDEALDIFIGDMAFRVHPTVRAYMKAMTPGAGETRCDDLSGQAVGAWEKGANLPSRRNVFALEQVYGTESGYLAGMIGYAVTNDPADEIAELRERIEQLEAIIAKRSASKRGL